MGYDEQSAALEIGRLRDALRLAEQRIAALEQQLAEALAALEESRRTTARQAAPFRREEHQKVAPDQRKKPGRPPASGAKVALPVVGKFTGNLSGQPTGNLVQQLRIDYQGQNSGRNLYCNLSLGYCQLRRHHFSSLNTPCLEWHQLKP